jgi:hypothetical protein
LCCLGRESGVEFAIKNLRATLWFARSFLVPPSMDGVWYLLDWKLAPMISPIAALIQLSKGKGNYYIFSQFDFIIFSYDLKQLHQFFTLMVGFFFKLVIIYIK